MVGNNIFKTYGNSNLCVFISHKKEDAQQCKAIASYIMKLGVDVYLDEYDPHLRRSRSPEQVVNSIKNGIRKSTHMLCVYSPQTIKSQWVPWEIGYGTGTSNIDVSVLTLKGIRDNDLPEFLQVTNTIRGTASLNEYLKRISSSVRFGSLIREYRNTIQNHPLDSVLDYDR